MRGRGPEGGRGVGFWGGGDAYLLVVRVWGGLCDLDWEEYGGEMAVVMDDGLGDGWIEQSGYGYKTSVLWAVAVVC